MKTQIELARQGLERSAGAVLSRGVLGIGRVQADGVQYELLTS